jgi:hypothetical protein
LGWLIRLSDWCSHLTRQFHLPVAEDSPHGLHIVDILRGNQVIEIQTGNFASIKRKVRDLSCRYRVTLIYPVTHERWILESPRLDQAAQVANASGGESTIQGTRELSRPLELPELFRRGGLDSRRTGTLL